MSRSSEKWLTVITRLIWAVMAGAIAFGFLVAKAVTEHNDTCGQDCGGFFEDFGYVALAVVFGVLAVVSFVASLHAAKTMDSDGRSADPGEGTQP